MNNQEKRNARALLASIAGEATQGSMRLVCPFCHGGHSRETSLVLTIRGDGTFYCCHRAACGESGIVNPSRVTSLTPIVQENRPKPFDLPFRALKDGDVWLERYNEAVGNILVTQEMVCRAGLYVSELDSEEAVWVLRGFDNELRGYQTRINYSLGGKRVRTFKDVQGYMYHVIPAERERDTGNAVVVEDAMSAACLATHGYTGIALLGTYLPEELASEIDEQNFAAITVALDPGAEKEAKRAYDTLRASNAGATYHTYLPKDFKNMDRQTRNDVLNYVFG